MSGLRSNGFHRLLDALLPRTCAICGDRLSPSEEYVCLGCKSSLPYTYFWESPTDNPMAQLFFGMEQQELRAAALFYYLPGSPDSEIVKDIKYRSLPDMGRSMGQLAAEAMQESGFFDGIDALVPVPLAWRRRLKRGYNQSLKIAQGISKVTSIPIYNSAVVRTRNVGSQTLLGGEERRRNVEGIFSLRQADKIRGKHLLLIDDIVTTGSTCRSCAEELLKAEGVRISILSLGFTRRIQRGY